MADVRPRLDALLVELGLSPTRSRAADAIRRGGVSVDGRAVTKPGASVSATSNIVMSDAASGLASRGGLKLQAALETFSIDPAGKHCLDVGASTGGFTDVLLNHGAAHVTAVDVGRGQLLKRLADDRRVSAYERLDARDLAVEHLRHPPELIVADLSFIGLEKALPAALALAAARARLVALIKPQFEAGPEHVGKGGIVRDPAVHEAVCNRTSAWLESSRWHIHGVVPSPIEGGSGNREFLIGASR